MTGGFGPTSRSAPRGATFAPAPGPETRAESGQ